LSLSSSPFTLTASSVSVMYSPDAFTTSRRPNLPSWIPITPNGRQDLRYESRRDQNVLLPATISAGGAELSSAVICVRTILSTSMLVASPDAVAVRVLRIGTSRATAVSSMGSRNYVLGRWIFWSFGPQRQVLLAI
jgi:hypothetical protein